MKAVMVIGGVFYLIFDSAVDVGVADGVSDVMAEKSAHIGNGLFSLLSGFYLREVAQTGDKKIMDMVFVHVGADVSVVPVSQNGNIVKKHIRTLETKLIKPAVFGNDTL
jgi:hypothetical protein